MLWIKRIVFVLAIIIVVSGQFVWNKLSLYLQQSQAHRYAKITAQTWIAYAKFNNAPEKYRQYRDSLLTAVDISQEDINNYLTRHKKHPEKYIHFATLVNFYVDSLVAAEDSTLKAVPDIADK